MSLILEALKRSEAERRTQGGVPAALSPASPARRVPGLLWGMATLVALLGVAGGWWGSRHWAGGDPPRQATLAAPPPAVGTTADTGSRPADSGPPPGPSAEPAAAEAPGEVVSQGPPPTTLVRLQEPQSQQAAAAEATLAAAAQDPVATDDSTPAFSRASADSTDSPASGQELPLFNQLPALRAEFGQLEINMLVYSASAEARFALINLQRVAEGEEVQSGLLVQEIRRDGVVLSHRGRALLLPSGH